MIFHLSHSEIGAVRGSEVNVMTNRQELIQRIAEAFADYCFEDGYRPSWDASERFARIAVTAAEYEHLGDNANESRPGVRAANQISPGIAPCGLGSRFRRRDHNGARSARSHQCGGQKEAEAVMRAALRPASVQFDWHNRLLAGCTSLGGNRRAP